MNTKQISVSEFKAHCAEELREVQIGHTTLEITKHGKVIATVQPPKPKPEPGSLLGAGKAYGRFGPDYDPHEPAFAYEDWEMHRDDQEDGE